MTRVRPNQAQQGDVWANARRNHCGVVVSVEVDERRNTRNITIEHCSSGQGGVVRNDWATHFNSGGTFYRPVRAGGGARGSGRAARVVKSKFPVREVFA
jgi:hypothetical protein